MGEKPKSAPAPDPRELLARAKSQQEQKEYSDYIDAQVKHARRMLFGIPPNSPEGQFLSDAQKRLKAKEGYTKLQERIMLTIRKRLEEIRDTVVRAARERKETIEKTEQLLHHETDAFMRTITVMGQAAKMREMPYGKRSEVGPEADRQILEPTEVVILERFAQALEGMDFAEVMQTMVEDQPFISLLAKSQQAAGESVRDYQLTKLEKNPESASFDDLRDLILQRPINGKERSANRSRYEGILWVQIVRNMDIGRKHALVRAFLNDKSATPEQQVFNAKDFIHAAVLAGALTREDAMRIYDVKEVKDRFKADPKDFAKQIAVAVRDRDEARTNIEYAAKKIEKPVGNFAAYYFQLPNLLMSRAFDMGAITAALNVVLDFTEQWKLTPGGWDKKIAAGIGTVAKDKYIWGALGVMAGSSDYVFPWIKQATLAKSKDEEREEKYHAEYAVLRDKLQNHPVMEQFMVFNFNDYVTKMNTRKMEGKPEELLPTDIRLEDKDAWAMGFENADEAKAVVIRLFKIFTKDLAEQKIENSEKLYEFLQKTVYNEDSRYIKKAPKT